LRNLSERYFSQFLINLRVKVFLGKKGFMERAMITAKMQGNLNLKCDRKPDLTKTKKEELKILKYKKLMGDKNKKKNFI